MEYNISDCMELHSVISSDIGAVEALSYTQDVIIGLRDIVRERQMTQLDIEDVFRHWIDRFIGVSKSRKVFNFLFSISLDDAPMYINDTDLKMFVKWRFRIAK